MTDPTHEEDVEHEGTSTPAAALLRAILIQDLVFWLLISLGVLAAIHGLTIRSESGHPIELSPDETGAVGLVGLVVAAWMYPMLFHEHDGDGLDPRPRVRMLLCGTLAHAVLLTLAASLWGLLPGYPQTGRVDEGWGTPTTTLLIVLLLWAVAAGSTVGLLLLKLDPATGLSWPRLLLGLVVLIGVVPGYAWFCGAALDHPLDEVPRIVGVLVVGALVAVLGLALAVSRRPRDRTVRR